MVVQVFILGSGIKKEKGKGAHAEREEF